LPQAIRARRGKVRIKSNASAVRDKAAGASEQTYEQVGADPKRPLPQQLKDWSEARTWYQRGVELFGKLRDLGTLMPSASEEPQKFSAKVQECDNAIARQRK
jgi:hypothetical protein